MFRNIGRIEFTGYHRQYHQKIRYIFVPGALIEFTCAWALPIMAPSLWSLPAYQLTLALLLLIWVSTFLIQGPLHAVLRREFEPYEHRLLVQTNWIRTGAWTLRGIILTLLFLQWVWPR